MQQAWPERSHDFPDSCGGCAGPRVALGRVFRGRGFPKGGDAAVVTEQAPLRFGGLLRQLRAEAKLTQEELAEAARLSPRAVSGPGAGRQPHRAQGHRRVAGRLRWASPGRPGSCSSRRPGARSRPRACWRRGNGRTPGKARGSHGRCAAARTGDCCRSASPTRDVFYGPGAAGRRSWRRSWPPGPAGGGMVGGQPGHRVREVLAAAAGRGCCRSWPGASSCRGRTGGRVS